MRSIQLSFGNSPLQQWLGHQSNRWTQVFAVLCALVAVTTLVWSLQRLTDLQMATQRAEQALQRAQLIAARSMPVVKISPPKLTQAELAGFNRAVAHLNAPWSAIFRGLESRSPLEVALVSIEPDIQTGHLKIVAEAKALEAAYRYADSMGATPPFAGVSLVKHEAYEQDPLRPFRLTFELALSQPAPSPLKVEP